MRGAEGGEINAGFGRLSIGDGGHVDDADVVILLSGGGEEGEEKFYEQRVPEVVGRELDFVAVFAEARGQGHDTGIEHENVETDGAGFEGFGSGFDGGQGGDVAGEEGDGDVRGGDAHFFDEGVSILLVAAGEEDVGGMMFGELGDGALA